jgi:two-component sensor histidine kinase
MLEVGQARQALAVLQEVMQQNPPLNQLNRVSVAVSFGLCYQGLKQYQKAEQYFLEAVSLSEQANDYQYQVFAWYQISQFYVVTAQYKKAKAYVKRLPTTITTISQEPRDKLEFLLMHFKVDSALADYPSAIKHYQLYTALKDSIFNVTKSKQIEELGVRYDIEKKEQDLKLKEKNIALLRAQSKAQLNLRNALIGGTGLLLVLLAVIYNRFRLKRRSNQLLEAQQQALQARQEEINHKNTTLQQLLIEKERLLKEIHHRVKNNLQVVMSLLDSQADSLKDKAALSAIQESQHRVQAMALIHQKLYQSESVAHIPMNSYIEEVVAYLNDSYSLYQPTRFDVEVEDIELDVTLAVPLGLIINEAITNAFKYAFPHERSGRITVHLKRLAEASYELVIADDGVGLPASYDPSRSRSLGMTLIHGFSRQLGGKLTITSPPGMCISLMFQEENLSPVQNQTSYVYSS